MTKSKFNQRNVLALLGVFIVMLSMVSTALAIEVDNSMLGSNDSTVGIGETASIVNGSIANCDTLEKSLKAFFESRNIDENTADEEAMMRNDSDTVRLNAMDIYSAGAELTIVSATSTPIVVKITYNINGDIVLDVYEWVAIKYIPDGSLIIDEMGYSNQHQMTFRLIDNEYVCIDDVNDELDLLLYGDCKETISNEWDGVETTGVLTANTTFDDYDVEAVIEYADEYVDHKIYTDTATGPHKYNATYGYFKDNDCANYVSQCIYAGGMTFDYGNGADYTSKDQWWFDTSKVVANKSNATTTCPPPWRSVSNMKSYFEGKGYKVESVKSGGTNIYPGNPVYASGHIVMCVGYNSAGKPICNGHTRDVWHYVYNYATASSGRSTILIVDSDKT